MTNQKLKFICLNTWLGGKRWEDLLTFVKGEKPDILAVQEAHNEPDTALETRFRTVSLLTEALALPHAHFAPALIRPETGVIEGNAVLSRFPIKQREVQFFDQPFGITKEDKVGGDFTRTPRNLEHVLLDIDGRKLHVFNIQGIWGFDGLDNPRRLTMIKSVIEAMQGHTPAILCGDFNVQEGTRCISMLQEALVDPFKGERQGSFNMRIKSGGGFGTAVVDFIFVTPDIKVTRHESPDIDASDHLPLIVELEI